MNENIDSSISNNVATKIISHAEKQNELIFATRERLFKLERTQNTDCKILITLMGCLCVAMILMCLEFGGFKW
jgi:uncharacterized membrane protein